MFDSDRRPGAAFNNSDLFVMGTDGSEQSYLVHGSSASWSRDNQHVAFDASETGLGTPIRDDPGSATTDSDIFTISVGDALEGVGERKNITNSPTRIDEDPDWSPDGKVIVFTSHGVNENQQNPTLAEIYVIKAHGKDEPTQLTFNNQEERAPAWSPDGTKILYMCKATAPTNFFLGPDFEICVMNADGTDQKNLTNNSLAELTPNWSFDGTKIFFHRPVFSPGLGSLYQLFRMNANGTGVTKITGIPGHNGFANGGAVRTRVPK